MLRLPNAMKWNWGGSERAKRKQARPVIVKW